MGGDGWDDAAFLAAAAEAVDEPGALAARLFSLRAAMLLNGAGPATSRARLSGLLVGLEIAGARDYWEGRKVVLIGAPGLTAPYHAALAAEGASVTEEDGADMTLSGLRRAYEEYAK